MKPKRRKKPNKQLCRLRRTEKDCERLIANAKTEAEKKAQDMFETAKADGRKELEEAEALAEIKCNKISENAEKNRSDVIKKAVNYLFD